MATMVYAYAAKVLSGAEQIAEQISAAHKYYNRLIELYRDQRLERHRLICATCPDYDEAHRAVEAAHARVEEIADGIRRQNAAAKRKRATKEESESLRDAKEARKAATARRKEVRERIAGDEKLQAALGDLEIEYNGVPIEGSDRRAGGKFKDARHSCGCYWGTYLKIEAAVEMARKKFGEPRVRRWDGSGQVAIQVQGGASWHDVVSGEGRVKNLLQFVSHVARSKHRAPHVTFRMCVATNEKKHPIWCDVRASWTRDLPADAKIMGVSLVRIPRPLFRTKGGRYVPQSDWSLQFTVRTQKRKERATTGACGVDLGWRLMPDGSMRVAYYAGDDSKHGDLRLPAKLLARWEKAKSIQGIRDRHFNAALEQLSDWKAAHKEAPEWFAEATKFCSQWRGKGKIGRLLDQWAEARMEGDEEIFAALSAWRARDVHLQCYADFTMDRAQRIRKLLYLRFGADLRKRYQKIVVEDCDWRKLAHKKDADDNTFDLSKYWMRVASIGKLRQILTNDGAAPSEAKDTTRTCHECGSLEEWDHAIIDHTCSACSLPWDQDYNAAMNLLARVKLMKDEEFGLGSASAGAAGPIDAFGARDASRETESSETQEVAPAKPDYVGRWARRKAARSQKPTETKAG